MTFLQLLKHEQRHWARKHLPRAVVESLYAVYPPASGHKIIARRFLEEAGLAVPDLYASGVSLREALRVVADTSRCFLKPEHGWGAIATIGLAATDKGYVNTLSGEARALNTWAKHLCAERMRYGLRDRWMVEELLTRPGSTLLPPDEYKFYAFAGRIELICLRRATWENRAAAVFRWVDAQWNPVNTGLFEERQDDSLPLLQGEERATFMEAAQLVSRQRPVPFMRIDLYRTEDTLVAGELTLLPGGSFNSYWRTRLTTAWHEAALKMSTGILRGDLADVMALNQRILDETRPIWSDVVRWEKQHRFARLAKWPLRCSRSSFFRQARKRMRPQ